MNIYRTWAVPKLKQELSARGAILKGRKIDLIDRLEAYDRNQDFRSPVILLPESCSVQIDWPSSGYRQLTKDHKIIFSKLTREQIDGYFLYRLAGDKQVTGDIKALEKGQALLNGNKILACSVQVVGAGIFLSGIVSAAMKKQVTYNFKIKMDKTNGSPVNACCECPAGKGPSATCKHIAAVMLMLQHLLDTGEIKVEKSCTEDLQTFHRPKAFYNGQPLKVESYPSKRKAEYLMEDPRPTKYQNHPGYNDLVRNLTINYCSISSEDIAMRYLIPKANLQVAQKDHDYLDKPFGEYWVDQALKVSEAEASQLEIKTRGQANNKKWFEARRWRLTASRFGEICRITAKRNMKKLCSSLVNPANLTTPAVQHGKMYEGKAILTFEKDFNMETSKCGLFISSEKPYIGATPDATIDEHSIVEVKCPYNGRDEKIKPSPFFNFLEFDDCNNIVLKKTSKYYDQVQGQLYICKREICYFVVYTFSDMFVQRIEIDRQYCENCIFPKIDLFYSKHFRPYLATLF